MASLNSNSPINNGGSLLNNGSVRNYGSSLSISENRMTTPSDMLVDIHVYVLPKDKWIPFRRLAKNHVIEYTVSAGFVRVSPYQNLSDLRGQLEMQLEHELPDNFVYIRSVGRNFTQVKPHQEVSLKVKHFLPPLTIDPEIHVMEVSEELLQHTGSLSNLIMSESEFSDGLASGLTTSRFSHNPSSLSYVPYGRHSVNMPPNGLYDQGDMNYLRLRLHDNQLNSGPSGPSSRHSYAGISPNTDDEMNGVTDDRYFDPRRRRNLTYDQQRKLSNMTASSEPDSKEEEESNRIKSRRKSRTKHRKSTSSTTKDKSARRSASLDSTYERKKKSESKRRSKSEERKDKSSYNEDDEMLEISNQTNEEINSADRNIYINSAQTEHLDDTSIHQSRIKRTGSGFEITYDVELNEGDLDIHTNGFHPIHRTMSVDRNEKIAWIDSKDSPSQDGRNRNRKSRLYKNRPKSSSEHDIRTVTEKRRLGKGRILTPDDSSEDDMVKTRKKKYGDEQNARTNATRASKSYISKQFKNRDGKKDEIKGNDKSDKDDKNDRIDRNAKNNKNKKNSRIDKEDKYDKYTKNSKNDTNRRDLSLPTRKNDDRKSDIDRSSNSGENTNRSGLTNGFSSDNEAAKNRIFHRRKRNPSRKSIEKDQKLSEGRGGTLSSIKDNSKLIKKKLPKSTSLSSLDSKTRSIESQKAELSNIITERKNTEDLRHKLFNKAKALHEQILAVKEQRRESWWTEYQAAKKTGIKLEEKQSGLRSELDSLHRRIISTLIRKQPIVTGVKDSPSRRANFKISVIRLRHEVQDLKRKAEAMDIKLAAEIKLREQAEREVKQLREEVGKKKANVAVTKQRAASQIRTLSTSYSDLINPGTTI